MNTLARITLSAFERWFARVEVSKEEQARRIVTRVIKGEVSDTILWQARARAVRRAEKDGPELAAGMAIKWARGAVHPPEAA